MSDIQISFNQVTKRYHDGFEAVSQLNFDIARGEMVFLTGHSGAGKSTVIKLLSAIEKPTQGRLHVIGHSLNKITTKNISLLRQHMGIILQDPALLMDRNAFDNVALPLEIAGFRYADIQRRVHAALSKVGLGSKEKLFPSALSAGEQQRLSIARAVVNKPALLIADEPTGNLDPLLSKETFKLFQQFNQVGVTVLIASHDLALLSQFNYRLLELDHGRLKQDSNKSAKESQDAG